MVKTIQDYYYNAETGVPMKTSMFTLLLNLALRLVYKMAKAVSSATQMVFPPGFDNKIIDKE